MVSDVNLHPYAADLVCAGEPSFMQQVAFVSALEVDWAAVADAGVVAGKCVEEPMSCAGFVKPREDGGGVSAGSPLLRPDVAATFCTARCQVGL